MIIINLQKEKNKERALRTYKNKVQKTKQIQIIRERKEYVKPSVKKREMVLNAIYKEEYKNNIK